MKGVSLPINAIIIIALGIIVLLAVAAWFVGQIGRQTPTNQADFMKACRAWSTNYSLSWDEFDVYYRGESHTMQEACQELGGIDHETLCKETCKKLLRL